MLINPMNRSIITPQAQTNNHLINIFTNKDNFSNSHNNLQFNHNRVKSTQIFGIKQQSNQQNYQNHNNVSKKAESVISLGSKINKKSSIVYMEDDLYNQDVNFPQSTKHANNNNNNGYIEYDRDQIIDNQEEGDGLPQVHIIQTVIEDEQDLESGQFMNLQENDSNLNGQSQQNLEKYDQFPNEPEFIKQLTNNKSLVLNNQPNKIQEFVIQPQTERFGIKHVQMHKKRSNRIHPQNSKHTNVQFANSQLSLSQSRHSVINFKDRNANYQSVHNQLTQGKVIAVENEKTNNDYSNQQTQQMQINHYKLMVIKLQQEMGFSGLNDKIEKILCYLQSNMTNLQSKIVQKSGLNSINKINQQKATEQQIKNFQLLLNQQFSPIQRKEFTLFNTKNQDSQLLLSQRPDIEDDDDVSKYTFGIQESEGKDENNTNLQIIRDLQTQEIFKIRNPKNYNALKQNTQQKSSQNEKSKALRREITLQSKEESRIGDMFSVKSPKFIMNSQFGNTQQIHQSNNNIQFHGSSASVSQLESALFSNRSQLINPNIALSQKQQMSVISQFQIVNFNQSNNNPILNQSMQSRDQLLKNYLNFNKLPMTNENKANHDASKQSIDQLLYQSGCMDDNDICELCNEPFDQHDVDMNFELNHQIECYQDVLQNTTYNQSIVTQHQQQLKQKPIQQQLENAKNKKKLNSKIPSIDNLIQKQEFTIVPYETTNNQFFTAKQNRDFNRDLYSSKLSKAQQTRSQTRMSQLPNASQKNLELKSRGQKSMEFYTNFQNYHSVIQLQAYESFLGNNQSQKNLDLIKSILRKKSLLGFATKYESLTILLEKIINQYKTQFCNQLAKYVLKNIYQNKIFTPVFLLKKFMIYASFVPTDIFKRKLNLCNRIQYVLHQNVNSRQVFMIQDQNNSDPSTKAIIDSKDFDSLQCGICSLKHDPLTACSIALEHSYTSIIDLKTQERKIQFQICKSCDTILKKDPLCKHFTCNSCQISFCMYCRQSSFTQQHLNPFSVDPCQIFKSSRRQRRLQKDSKKRSSNKVIQSNGGKEKILDQKDIAFQNIIKIDNLNLGIDYIGATIYIDNIFLGFHINHSIWLKTKLAKQISYQINSRNFNK
eukprot:403356237